jgi:hypothetical protein
MRSNPRFPAIFHCTPEPFRFFGRTAELRVLDDALTDPAISVIGLVGPGGQGKTAIVQHWLQPLLNGARDLDGLFFWSFYRGKDVDLCLRELYAYASGMAAVRTAASYCVDHLLPILRRERLVIVLDGAEVVQHETGAWAGRFMHPELARLLEEMASESAPGLIVVTTRFTLPTLVPRRHARLIDLAVLDPASARELLRSVGVQGDDPEFDEAAGQVGWHAKGVELLGTWLAHFGGGAAAGCAALLPTLQEQLSFEERHVARVLAAFQATLPAETRDILALATAFRQPPTEARLLEYLVSSPVRAMLHVTWKRIYPSFDQREWDWLPGQIDWLVQLRLLERVGSAGRKVIDAHPLVRRGFEQYLGPEGQRQNATARAGFLRGRPDRRPPQSLEEAREEVELFHAYCDAGMWSDADNILVALDNPKHRFLAPAFERDLLLRFFDQSDWRRPPLWAGFGRWRSLAICLELLGQFEDALDVYRPADVALRGDALIALGHLEPMCQQESVSEPWQNLWRAYRAHALCLTGKTAQAVALARTLIPVDIYEWVHVFECLLRAGQLREGDARAMKACLQVSEEHGWKGVVAERMWVDWMRIANPAADLDESYRRLAEAFDRGGLPWERAMLRLGHARWLLQRDRGEAAKDVLATVVSLGQRHGMQICLVDALELLAAGEEAQQIRQRCGYRAAARP